MQPATRFSPFPPAVWLAVVSFVCFRVAGLDLALVLSFLSGFLAMLPILSSWLIWVPVVAVLFASGRVYEWVFVASAQIATVYVVDPLIYSLIPCVSMWFAGCWMVMACFGW